MQTACRDEQMDERVKKKATKVLPAKGQNKHKNFGFHVFLLIFTLFFFFLFKTVSV